MHSAITALFDMIKQALQYGESKVEHCLETSTVGDKKNLKKACDNAEKILILVDKYVESFDKKDLKQYNKLKEKFFKYN